MKNDNLLKKVGSKVKAIPLSKGITVGALAAMCETDYSNLSRFENGQKNIRLLTLSKISEKLKIDIKDLL
jgi:transcriptional regulator with XRE-family HTH domain